MNDVDRREQLRRLDENLRSRKPSWVDYALVFFIVILATIILLFFSRMSHPDFGNGASSVSSAPGRPEAAPVGPGA
jgi:hypothetical protein